jgi:phthiodiolone/phenolphthiodiolone dimycocerosates ketoreductase
MKVGLALGNPYEELDGFETELDIARAAQVDSVWILDHLWGVFHPALWHQMSYSDAASSPDAYADPFVLAGLLAARVEVPFGTGVTDSTRRRAPDMIRAALTLHHLSPGGFMLGVGSGEAENIVPFGYPFEKPVGRLEEFLIEARSLLDQGRMPAPLHGTLGLPAANPFSGKLTVWVAAHGPRALRLAGTYGDGWISAFVDEATFREQLDTVAQHAAKAGRPTPKTRATLIVILGESRDEVVSLLDREPLAKLIAMLGPSELWAAFGLEKPGGHGAGYRDMLLHDLDPESLADIAPSIPPELLEAQGVYLGSAEEIAGKLQPYRDAGVQHLTIANFSGLVGGRPRLTAMKQQFVDLVRHLDTPRAQTDTISAVPDKTPARA